MSIDARVNYVLINEDGSGELRLIARPARSGQVSGTVGQRSLSFQTAPEEVTALNGLDIWGGANSIVLGDVEIAKRIGYTRIEFYSRDIFIKAVKEYHQRTKAAR